MALRQKQKYDLLLERLAWERARMISFFTLKPNDSKKKLKRFSDVIEFSWEKEDKPKLDPEKEMARIKAFYADKIDKTTDG